MAQILAVLPGKSAATSRMTGKPTLKRERKDAQDDLYIMKYRHDSTVVKIGRSNNVRRRKADLEQSQNFYIDVVAVFPNQGSLESAIHKQLANKRSCKGPGTEWFEIEVPEALQVIKDVLESK